MTALAMVLALSAAAGGREWPERRVKAGFDFECPGAASRSRLNDGNRLGYMALRLWRAGDRVFVSRKEATQQRRDLIDTLWCGEESVASLAAQSGADGVELDIALHKMRTDFRSHFDGAYGGDPTDDWVVDSALQRALLRMDAREAMHLGGALWEDTNDWSSCGHGPDRPAGAALSKREELPFEQYSPWLQPADIMLEPAEHLARLLSFAPTARAYDWAVLPGHKQALLDAAICSEDSAYALTKRGDYAAARTKLLQDVRPRMDGQSGGEAADDWITHPLMQREMLVFLDGWVGLLTRAAE